MPRSAPRTDQATEDDAARDWVTALEAAAIAEVEHSTVRGWCTRYRLGHRVGGRLRIKRADLTRFLAGEWSRDRRPE